MTDGQLGASFRDPHGFMFERDGVLYRQVNKAHAQHYDALIASGLYERLVEERLLVAHEEVAEPAWGPAAHRVLRPDPVPFVSYPYEWCFSALRDAALTTLRIQELALDHGLSLRDASAFNIQFCQGTPLLIDTLSFESQQEGKPWIAYRQFCEHFLGPLALMSSRDVRLNGLFRARLEGIPIDMAAALLPTRSKLKPGLALHVHGQAAASNGPRTAPGGRGTAVSPRAMRGLVESLRAAVIGLRAPEPHSGWTDYYEGDSYTAAGMDEKRRVVKDWLAEVRPQVVWDMGANTGEFSRIAADADARVVVSIDADHDAVELNYRRMRQEHRSRLLPLVVDAANPTPALGWNLDERMSLAARGPADVLLALALVHHLAIAGNVPLDSVAAFFAGIAEDCIVEFVPKTDPKVQLLLADRQDVFPHYSREGFEAAFARHFRIVQVGHLPHSDRVLYLLVRR